MSAIRVNVQFRDTSPLARILGVEELDQAIINVRLDAFRVPIDDRESDRAAGKGVLDDPAGNRDDDQRPGRCRFASVGGHEELAEPRIAIFFDNPRRRKYRLQEAVCGRGQGLGVGHLVVILDIQGQCGLCHESSLHGVDGYLGAAGLAFAASNA